MKIVTYNVNGIKARLERLVEYLAEQQPDVVCLQELKSSDETFPEAAIRDVGYGAVWALHAADDGGPRTSACR